MEITCLKYIVDMVKSKLGFYVLMFVKHLEQILAQNKHSIDIIECYYCK